MQQGPISFTRSTRFLTFLATLLSLFKCKKSYLNIPKCIHHFGIPYIAQSPTTLNALGNVDWVGCPMLG